MKQERKMNRCLQRVVLGLCLSLGLGGLSGCGAPTVANHEEFEDLHPVTGQIDFKGEPIPDATINLYPVGVALSRAMTPVASGVVDETGKFELFTYREGVKGRGVVQGEYEVSMSWSGPLQGLTDEKLDELKEKLPMKYVNPKTSGVKITVSAGENTVPPISLQ